MEYLYRVLDAANDLNRGGGNCSLKMYTFTWSESVVLMSILLKMATDPMAIPVMKTMRVEEAELYQKWATSLFSTLFTSKTEGIIPGLTLDFDDADNGDFLCVLDGSISEIFGLPIRVWEFSLAKCAEVFSVECCGSKHDPQNDPLGYHELSSFVVSKAGRPLQWDTITNSMKKSSFVTYQLLSKVRSSSGSRPSCDPKNFRWVSMVELRGSLWRKRILGMITNKALHDSRNIFDKYAKYSIEEGLRTGEFYKVTPKQISGGKLVFSIDGKITSKGTPVTCWILVPYGDKDVLMSIRRIMCTMKKSFSDDVTPPEGWIVTSSDHPREGDSEIGLSFRSYVRGGFTLVLHKKRIYLMCPWIHDSRPRKHWKYVVDEPDVVDVVDSGIAFDKSLSIIDKEALRILGDDGTSMFKDLATDQKDAMKRIIERRLSLLWGPPQTGVSTVLLKIVAVFTKAAWEIGSKDKEIKTDQLRILYTTKDDHARDIFLDNVKTVRDSLGLPSSSLGIGMMHSVRTKKNFNVDLKGFDGKEEEGKRVSAPETDASPERIKTKEGVLRQPADFYSECVVSVVAGTIHKMANPNYCNERMFDIIIWEDSCDNQSPDLHVVLSRLNKKNGRLILAGNPLQANDLSFVYEGTTIPVTGLVTPEDCWNYSNPLSITKPVFSFIFEELKRRGALLGVLDVLNHNWCMNDELCGFLREEIYRFPDVFPKDFEPGSEALRSASFISDELFPSENPLNRAVFDPTKSLAVVVFPWDRVSSFDHANLEDETVLDLLKSIRNTTEMKKLTDTAFCLEKFMVATASHRQRDSIGAKLERILKVSSDVIPVREKQRNRKKNCDVCLADMAVFKSEKVREEPYEFYNVGDLSVLLSRGKKKCIVLLSEHVLCGWKPRFIVGNEQWARGLRILHDLVRYADKHHCLFVKKI